MPGMENVKVLFVHFTPSAFPAEQRAPFSSASESKPLSQSKLGALRYKTAPCNIQIPLKTILCRMAVNTVQLQRA